MHLYIESTNPTPDEQTLMALIESNDELSIALSKYSHALLDSRKEFGDNPQHSRGKARESTSSARPARVSFSVSSGSSASSASGAVVDAPMTSGSSDFVSSSTAGPSVVPQRSRSVRHSEYIYSPEDYQDHNPFNYGSNGKARMNA